MSRRIAGVALIIACGFVMIGLGWRAVARTQLVDLELPGLVSGSVAGLLLVGVGTALGVGLTSRRAEAAMREEMERCIVEAKALLASLEDKSKQ
jgi:hypothetical protein